GQDRHPPFHRPTTYNISADPTAATRSDGPGRPFHWKVPTTMFYGWRRRDFPGPTPPYSKDDTGVPAGPTLADRSARPSSTTVLVQVAVYKLSPVSPPFHFINHHDHRRRRCRAIARERRCVHREEEEKEVMTGVWVFEDGMVRRADSEAPATGGRGAGGKLLVHVPSSEVVTSYDVLERRLRELGWERYLNDPCLLQFHQRSTVHLISVPRDFSRLKLVHMYDIVVKTRNIFEVRDAVARS
ncbi:hypothetical protein ABZP36_003824, partial [Zizania latifolia]